MGDDRNEPSRRRLLKTGIVATAMGSAGCLRLTGSDEVTTADGSAGAAETPSPTRSPPNDPAGAEFSFDYMPEDGRLVIRYTGGGHVRAGDLQIRSSDDRAIRWPELGSTTTRSEEFLASGATAILGPDILNWDRAVPSDATIRIVFAGEGSMTTLARYTPATTPEPTGTSEPTDTESPTETETPTGDVRIRFSRSIQGIASDGTVISANPAIELLPPTEVTQALSFVIENINTGDSLRVSFSSSKDPTTEALIFDINGPTGRLKSDPKIHCFTGNEFVSIEVNVDGDDSTFTANYLDDYRVTMLENGTEVASTGQHVVPIGHQLDFDYSVEDGTLRFSFNAGDLPSDAVVADAGIKTDDGRIAVKDTGYVESTNRYFGRIDADAVPSGTHTAEMVIREEGTDVWIINLVAELSV